MLPELKDPRFDPRSSQHCAASKNIAERRREELEQIVTLFRLLDTDEDGLISVRDLELALQPFVERGEGLASKATVRFKRAKSKNRVAASGE